MDINYLLESISILAYLGVASFTFYFGYLKLGTKVKVIVDLKEYSDVIPHRSLIENLVIINKKNSPVVIFSISGVVKYSDYDKSLHIELEYFPEPKVLTELGVLNISISKSRYFTKTSEVMIDFRNMKYEIWLNTDSGRVKCQKELPTKGSAIEYDYLEYERARRGTAFFYNVTPAVAAFNHNKLRAWGIRAKSFTKINEKVTLELNRLEKINLLETDTVLDFTQGKSKLILPEGVEMVDACNMSTEQIEDLVIENNSDGVVIIGASEALNTTLSRSFTIPIFNININFEKNH